MRSEPNRYRSQANPRFHLIKTTRPDSAGVFGVGVAPERQEPINMEVDLGMLVVNLFMLFQMGLAVLLVMPMPSNVVRGEVMKLVTRLFDLKTRDTLGNPTGKTNGFVFVYFSLLALDLFYFWNACSELLAKYDLTAMSCAHHELHVQIRLFKDERTAYATGFSMFMAFILNRLIRIQSQLHAARLGAKTSVPMGMPVGEHAKVQ